MEIRVACQRRRQLGSIFCYDQVRERHNTDMLRSNSEGLCQSNESHLKNAPLAIAKLFGEPKKLKI
jgi:hypothetical protein